jgi:hypothetical protein
MEDALLPSFEVPWQPAQFASYKALPSVEDVVEDVVCNDTVVPTAGSAGGAKELEAAVSTVQLFRPFIQNPSPAFSALTWFDVEDGLYVLYPSVEFLYVYKVLTQSLLNALMLVISSLAPKICQPLLICKTCAFSASELASTMPPSDHKVTFFISVSF